MNARAAEIDTPDIGTYFSAMSTEQLFALAAKTDRATPWHKYDRGMLLAFFWNRFGTILTADLCGYIS